MSAYLDLKKQWNDHYWKFIEKLRHKFLGPDDPGYNVYQSDWDSEWFWSVVSISPNITWDHIKQHPEYPWDWENVCANPNITPGIVRQNHSYPWNKCWSFLSGNINFGLKEFLEVHPKQLDWEQISANPKITLDMVLENDHLPWDHNAVARNKNLTWEDLVDDPDDPDHPLFPELARNPNINITALFRLIQEHEPDLLPRRDDILNDIATNPNLTWEDLKNNPYLYEALPRDEISGHPNITLDIIKENPDYPWYWRSVTTNPNITWEMIQDHPEFPWEISCYAENPNLDLFWVEKLYHSPEGLRKYQWYLSDIVTNDMEKGRDKWIGQQAIRIIKTYQIQRYWRKYSSDPTYALARRSIGNCLKSEEKS